jgi:hypothetical protein
MEKDSFRLRIASLTVFGIAMGFLEAAVVVYLRDLFYPEGFAFPLKPMSLHALSTEYLREIATIVMLFCMSIFGGRNYYERFSIFLYSFGIWDIFYYIWLKVLLDWPPSLFTFDILFLIPVVWVAPVLAPVICSITMIGIAWCICSVSQRYYRVVIRTHQGVLFIAGVFLIFITFIWDFSGIIIRGGFIDKFWTLSADPAFRQIVAEYVPTAFQWPLFAAGELLILISLVYFCKGTDKTSS